jgi:transposase InsO family protein
VIICAEVSRIRFFVIVLLHCFKAFQHISRREGHLKVLGWGWFYLSSNLDDYSLYIISWKLCSNMRAEDVTDTLDLALQASGYDQVAG